MNKLIDDATGQEVSLESKVKDFRGKEWVFQGLVEGGRKVYVWDPIGKTHRIFFPSVFRCTISLES